MGKLKLTPPGMPQDIKLSPDGKIFYVANMEANGVHVIDGDRLKSISFIPTGKGAHGLYVSRDSKYLYVANRGEGSVTLIDFKSREIAAKWQIPGGGSPDMGGCRLTEKCVAFRTGTMVSCMRSIPLTAACWRASGWEKVRMAYACILSQAVIRWATRGFSAKNLREDVDARNEC